MASFVKGSFSANTPFGKNEFLRSTVGIKVASYTLAAATVTPKTIDGWDNQKVLQPGTVLAKITSGNDSGKVGPFQAGATDGRQTGANIVGLNRTFLPWQLMDRDVEVGAVYTCVAVQGWCIEYDSSGLEIVLTDATADLMRGTKGLDVLFK